TSGRRAGTTSCRAYLADHARVGELISSLFAGKPQPPPDPVVWDGVSRRVHWVAALDDARDASLQALAALFLRDKAITPVGGLELDAAARMTLAALCCLPLLEFGEQGLHGWSQLIVYPDAFPVNRTHVDAAGVLHEWGD